MTKPDSVPRRVVLRRAVAAAALLFASGGCYWLFPGGAPAGLAGYPGQNAAATRSYLASLDFSREDSAFTGQLDCEDSSKCGGGPSVNIKIVPEKRAYRAPVDRALATGQGHIVARITNLDARPFHPYGLRPNDVAYLWVGSMPSGAPKIAVFRISESGQATLLATAQQAGYCPDAAPGRSRSAVHLNTTPMCTERSLYPGSQGTASSGQIASTDPGNTLLVAAAARAFSHARGLWFSCSLGCCEARGFEISEAQ